MYLLLKTIHIFGFVAWFGGLFFIVRIFVYHREAHDHKEPKGSILRKEYEQIEQRIFKIICRPAMILTWLCGIGMIAMNGWEWLSLNNWLHVKLGLLLYLSWYTEHCKVMARKLVDGTTTLSSFQFRLWNELPTILLLSIALLAVYKNTLNYWKAALGIVLFGLTIFALAKLYKNYREKTHKTQ